MSRRATDGDRLVRAIELAYDVGSSAEMWLQGLARAVAPMLNRGLGVLSAFYDASDGARVRVRGSVFGTDEIPEAGLKSLGDSWATLSPEQVERSFLCDRLVATHSEVLAPQGARLPKTLSELIDLGIPPRFVSIVSSDLRASDSLVIHCPQPDGTGLVIAALLPRLSRVSPSFRARWSKVALHVVNAHRLRQALDRARRTGDPDEADAILSPTGRLEHASFEASAAARGVLSDGVRKRERARGPLRRTAPDEALSLWQGLLTGRWSLVDQIDVDGKRFVLARKNEPNAPVLPGLTRRERQVLAMALRGQSNKLIAYSMGLAPSTVATHLASGARKVDSVTRARLRRNSTK